MPGIDFMARKGGTQRDFLTFCPAKDDPPHWYKLSITTNDWAKPNSVTPGSRKLGEITLTEHHPLDIPDDNQAHGGRDGYAIDRAMPELQLGKFL